VILEAATIIAATARLSALIAQDEITEPIRQKVDQWALDAPYGSPRERVAYLLSCSRCSSIWAAGIVMALWSSGNAGRALVRLLAVSQSALIVLDAQERLAL